jgi:hypothetical protein
MTRATWIVLFAAACSHGPSGAPDLAGDLAAYPRTIVMRNLLPTSPNNLLRDPFTDGNATPSFGQFNAYYVNGSSITLHRSFHSDSPVGGAASIGELRDLPDAGTSTVVRVRAPFAGGPGQFNTSVWISAGDATGAPVAFANVASSIDVRLDDPTGALLTKLTPAAMPQAFGEREWMQFSSSGIACPAGGWMYIELTDITRTLQMAAPEVTSSAIATP